MATTVQRPSFYEGQVLAAADLTATVDQARAAAARHSRYLHDLGITEGLTLTTEPRTDQVTGKPYVAITLQPGAAVDITGREVVVPAAVPLAEAMFRAANGGDKATDQLYPVFLAGRDQDPQTVALVPSGCGGTAQPDRVEESYQIIFGPLGSEQSLDEQTPPTVDAGPGDGTVPHRVLLGFVLWKDGHFAGTFPSSGSVRRRYAGVRADTVAARSGLLVLRPDPVAMAGHPALVLDGANGLLTYGRLTPAGSVDRLFEVNPQGDLFVAGKVLGMPTRVAVVSGVASDGMLLPLPEGVRDQEVASGTVTVHVQLTPQLDRPINLPDGSWALGPVTCLLDGDRRLHSQVRWMNLSTPGDYLDMPSTAAFLVVAAIAGSDGPGGGGTP